MVYLTFWDVVRRDNGVPLFHFQVIYRFQDLASMSDGRDSHVPQRLTIKRIQHIAINLIH
jgi:hypothetical protein